MGLVAATEEKLKTYYRKLSWSDTVCSDGMVAGGGGLPVGSVKVL